MASGRRAHWPPRVCSEARRPVLQYGKLAQQVQGGYRPILFPVQVGIRPSLTRGVAGRPGLPVGAQRHIQGSMFGFATSPAARGQETAVAQQFRQSNAVKARYRSKCFHSDSAAGLPARGMPRFLSRVLSLPLTQQQVIRPLLGTNIFGCLMPVLRSTRLRAWSLVPALGVSPSFPGLPEVIQGVKLCRLGGCCDPSSSKKIPRRGFCNTRPACNPARPAADDDNVRSVPFRKNRAAYVPAAAKPRRRPIAWARDASGGHESSHDSSLVFKCIPGWNAIKGRPVTLRVVARHRYAHRCAGTREPALAKAGRP